MREIRTRGREGLEALVLTARALGDEQALGLAAEGIGCPGSRFEWACEDRGTVGQQAVLAASRWLAENPSMAGALLRSAEPFDRALALISQAEQPARLIEILDGMQAEGDPLVVVVAMGMIECAERKAPDRWRQPLELCRERLTTAESWTADRCRPGAAGFDELRSKVQAGSYRKGTVSSRHGLLSIGIERPDGRQVALSAPCALRLYEQLAAAGVHPHWLVVPILYWGLADEAARREALAIALRDLERYPDGERNLILARAVNAGGRSPIRVRASGSGSRFDREELLEAAARQDLQAARPAIERFVLCRDLFGQDDLVALGGYLDPGAVADSAYAIGTRCEHGIEGAMIALLRLGDPRARELMVKLLRKPFPPLSTPVLYAVREHRSEELVELLQSAVRSGNPQAKRILDHLEQR